MPWQEVCPMDEKQRFIAALIAGDESVSAICEEFGISRKTGYQLWQRYQAQGAAGLAPRSRAPHVVPWAIPEAVAEAIIALRRAHPSWGPKKLRAKLRERAAAQSWPALSTIGELVRRAGLSQVRKRRRYAPPNVCPLRIAVLPNDVWCIDFKGWFRTGDGARCDPLTVSDAFSRYLLCIKVVAAPGYADCRSALERVFREYGLPRAIRSDNGAPFASVGAAGLSRLSLWWVKLGIAPERIAPGKPEQNGRHERMHRTLKAECANPPAASGAAQQRRFDQFRAEFNQQRPHEALGQTPPAKHYAPAQRSYPARIADPVYPCDYQLRRVRSNGEIKWQGEMVFIGQALIGEVIGLRETDEGDAEVYFGPISLGLLDAITLKLNRGPR
ncbi:MAG TPA: IS481 family transposase [Candidatus Binataceae bacterium]|nr:IS481 family transposase [Candidatus Binataceae bacterium]